MGAKNALTPTPSPGNLLYLLIKVSSPGEGNLKGLTKCKIFIKIISRNLEAVSFYYQQLHLAEKFKKDINILFSKMRET
jgi:hypothetical protein